MLKAKPIIFGDKCNIQDGVVFPRPHRMSNGTLSRGDAGREVHGSADEAIGIHGYGHGRDPLNGAERISN